MKDAPRGQFAFGVCAGGVTSALWFTTEGIFPWERRVAFLWLPVVVLAGLVVLGWLRKQFSAAVGYLLGVSPVAALPLLVLGIFGALRGWQSIYDFTERLQRRPFEATVWRDHPADRTRARMVDDLIQSRKLAGLTLPETQALLGPPSGNLGGSDCDLPYWLGTDRGWLCLSAANGRINKVRFREYHD